MHGKNCPTVVPQSARTILSYRTELGCLSHVPSVMSLTWGLEMTVLNRCISRDGPSGWWTRSPRYARHFIGSTTYRPERFSLQLLSSRSIGEVILPSSLSSYTNMSRQRIEFSQLTPNRCLRRCRSVLVGVQDETLRITNSACYSKNNVAEKMESKTQQTKASHRTCRRDAGVGASIQAAQVIEMQSMGALRAAGSMV